MDGWQNKLKAFRKDTNQDRDRFREQVYGFGRSQAQKAVWAEKKYENSLTSTSGSGTIKADNPLKISMQFFGTPNFKNQRTAGLKKSIRTFKANIETHKRKILEPEKMYDNWEQYSKAQQEGFKVHWEKEIKNFEKQLEAAEKELEQRGE
jgi:hypothetical protein